MPPSVAVSSANDQCSLSVITMPREPSSLKPPPRELSGSLRSTASKGAVRAALISIREAFTENPFDRIRDNGYSTKSATGGGKRSAFHDMLCLDVKPFQLRNIDEIVKEAKFIYSMSAERKKTSEAANIRDKPVRSQFSTLIAEIKEEENERRRLLIEKRRIADASGDNKLCRPASAPTLSPLKDALLSNQRSCNKARPKTVADSCDLTERVANADKSRRSSALDDAARRPSSCRNASPALSTAQSSFVYSQAAPSTLTSASPATAATAGAESPGMDRSRSPSMSAAQQRPGSRRASTSIFAVPTVPAKKGKVEKMRKELQEKRLSKLQNRTAELERRKAQRAEALERAKRTKDWLMIVAHLTRMGPLCVMIEQRRREILQAAMQTIATRAVRLIKAWWKWKPTELRLKRNPVAAHRLRGCLTRFWCIVQLKKRKASANLLLRFLRDSTGLSETTRKMYGFRSRVVRIQLYVRDWLDVQYARLQLLWLAMERSERRKAHQIHMEKVKSERSSLHALYAVKGFTETLTNIDHVNSDLMRLYAKQSRMMQRALVLQKREDIETAIAHAEAEEAAASSKEKYSQAVGHFGGASSANRASAIRNLAAAVGGARGNRAYVYKSQQWMRRLPRSPTNASRLAVLHSILASQRRRHMLGLDEYDSGQRRRGGGGGSGAGAGTGTGTGMGPDRVNMAELKRFLRDPLVSDNVDAVVHIDCGLGCDRRPFLLLTQGALEAVEGTAFPCERRHNASPRHFP